MSWDKLIHIFTICMVGLQINILSFLLRYNWSNFYEPIQQTVCTCLSFPPRATCKPSYLNHPSKWTEQIMEFLVIKFVSVLVINILLAILFRKHYNLFFFLEFKISLFKYMWRKSYSYSFMYIPTLVSWNYYKKMNEDAIIFNFITKQFLFITDLLDTWPGILTMDLKTEDDLWNL